MVVRSAVGLVASTAEHLAVSSVVLTVGLLVDWMVAETAERKASLSVDE